PRDGVALSGRGARPGDWVQLVVAARPDADPASPSSWRFASRADGGGIARFPFTASDVSKARDELFAQALTSDLRSNVVPLRELPALYLLVDESDSSARVVRFDPIRPTLDPPLLRLGSGPGLPLGQYP